MSESSQNVTRSGELLPCPFCGGEAQTLRNGSWWCVACRTPFCCDVGKFDTEAEAIAAWNTRAERTCKVIMEQHNDYGYQTQVDDYSFSLSCGHVVTWDDLPDYCPYCGARVVDE